MAWTVLFLAIIMEVIATTALKFSEGFTRLVPSIVVIVGYAISFYLLALALKVFPIGITYAIWSGAGIVLISLIGWFVMKQQIDLAGIIGISLILMGVIVINVFSKSIPN